MPAQSAGPIFERSEQHRRVPRDDGADDPERLTPRVAQNLLAQGNCLALEFATQAAEVAQYVDRRLRLGPGLGAERIPGLERDHAGKLLDPRLKCVGDAKEEPPALARNRA